MIRRAAHFLLGGALILGVRIAFGALAAPEPRLLELTVPEGTTDAELSRLTDEAILVEEAVRRGWLYTDPVIRRRLVQNMRFVAEDEPARDRRDEHRLLETALSMNMHRSDPVVRQRLLQRAALIAELGARSQPPSDAELREYVEAHRPRYSSPHRVRLSHVFLSGQRRGARLEADAQALAARLSEEAVPPAEAADLGDPFILPPLEGLLSTATLDARLGQGFGRAVARAEPARWTGPIASSYGLHLVWIHEAVPGAPLPFEEVRGRALRSWLHDQRRGGEEAFLRALRGRYDVRIVREEARR